MPGAKIRRNSVQTRDDLVSAAVRVTENPGLHFDARTVAAEAGRSLGTLTFHFKDLGELRNAAALHGLRLINQALRRAAQPPDKPMVRARAMARAYVHFAWRHPRLYRLIRAEVWSGDVHAQMVENREVARAVVAELQAAGLVRRGPVETPLAIIWIACHGVATVLLDQLEPRPNPDGLLEDVLDVVFAGLKPK